MGSKDKEKDKQDKTPLARTNQRIQSRMPISKVCQQHPMAYQAIL